MRSSFFCCSSLRPSDWVRWSRVLPDDACPSPPPPEVPRAGVGPVVSPLIPTGRKRSAAVGTFRTFAFSPTISFTFAVMPGSNRPPGFSTATTTVYVTTFWVTWAAFRTWTTFPVNVSLGKASTVNVTGWSSLIWPTSASATLVSTCIFVRSWAMVKSVGADRLAATVCPISTAREMTTPSTGARIVVWSRSTCAFAVCALASAWAARAFATSARERSICACWLRTAALAESRSALAWFTFASKISGSIRAITSPCRTTELKSADSCVIWPETWLPTWTVITALRLPVAETAAARGPRSTRANRYAGALAPSWTDEYAQTPAPTRDSRNTRDRTRFIRSARVRGDRAPNRTGLSGSARWVRDQRSWPQSVNPRKARQDIPRCTLQLTEAPVPAAQRDQLLVGPALNESALFEDEDQIGLGGRLKVVGDEQAGFPGHEAPERFPDPGLAFDIEARRRLVQDQDRRVADDGPCQGDPLFLPAREGTATLGDHGGVAVFELDDEIMGVGRLGGAHDFRNRGVGLAIRNVLLDAGGKQHRILRNDTDMPAEGLASIPLDVGPIDQDGSPDRVVEAEDQAGDRGLACTGRPHQHHPLTGGDRERHIGQHAPPVAVVERDVVEDDLALEPRRVDGIGHVAAGGFDFEDLP